MPVSAAVHRMLEPGQRTCPLQALAKMEDVVVCRCGTACLEDKDHMVHCPKCLFVFCAMCRDAWHPGQEVRSGSCFLLLMSATRLGPVQDHAFARHAAARGQLDSVGSCHMMCINCSCPPRL